MTLQQAARQYKQLGFSFYPLNYKSKKALNSQSWTQWQTRQPSDEEISYLFCDDFQRNIAIITGYGNLICLDFDNESTYQKWAEKYPIVTAIQKSSRGYHVLFRVEILPDFCNGVFDGMPVEVKNSGHSFTAWPSVHESGHEYFWIVAPWEQLLTIKDLSEVGISPMNKTAIEEWEPSLDTNLSPYIETVLRNQLQSLRETGNGNRNNQLFKVAATLYGFVKTGSLDKTLADNQIREVCQEIGLLSGEEAQKTKETLGSAWQKAKHKSIPKSNFVPASGKLDYSFVLNCAKSLGAGDGELFAKLHEDTVAYDPQEIAWYIWTGSHWQEDNNGQILHKFRNSLGAEYLEAASKARRLDKSEAEEKELKAKAGSLNYSGRLEEALKWAKYPLTNQEWDTNLDLLAFENGTLNLRSGQFAEPNPKDYMRVFVPRHWKSLDEEAPKFEQFLLETQNGDSSMVLYLKQLIFIGLLGQSNEAILPILWGSGRNGKSTFMYLMRDIFGTALCDIVDKDILLKRKSYGNGPTPELYKLRGLRIAFALETEEGEKLSPGKIKAITGRDPITARDMYRGIVTFTPTHTAFLLTNPKPSIPDDSGDDKALWYRLRLIPWTQEFIDEPILANQHKATNT